MQDQTFENGSGCGQVFDGLFASRLLTGCARFKFESFGVVSLLYAQNHEFRTFAIQSNRLKTSNLGKEFPDSLPQATKTSTMPRAKISSLDKAYLPGTCSFPDKAIKLYDKECLHCKHSQKILMQLIS